mmetsp:Transcript_39954/g.103241  ORF Transcript_39954/g.103241 Transcript_39954/m.103241 type:complete len:278 (+) Transcript_39954:386-1219(+)
MRVRPPPNCALNARGMPKIATSKPIREHQPSSTGTIIAVTGVLLTMALRGPTRRHKRTMPEKCEPGVPRTMLTRISNQPVAAMAFAIGKRNATLVTVVSDNPARTDEGGMMSARAKTQAPPMSTTSDGKVGRSNVISKIMKMVFASTKATFQNGTSSPPSPLVNFWPERRPIDKQVNTAEPMQARTSGRHKNRRATCAGLLGSVSSGAQLAAHADMWLGAGRMLRSLIFERTDLSSSARKVTTISGTFSGTVPVLSFGTISDASAMALVESGCAAAT